MYFKMKVFNFVLLMAIIAASVSAAKAESEHVGDAKPLHKEIRAEQPSAVQDGLQQNRDNPTRELFPRLWGYGGYGYGYPYAGYSYGYYGYPYAGYAYYGYPYGAYYGYGGYYW
ncbi:putative transmembrane protein [Toxoplasma gondii RUB]|uniref:Transmembrane protein n=8 Tax=Toxoplasma gondii TaxID=5811 RepID=S7W124_TOXGG|nr:hypothetical protein TGGT1_316550 [Toxoplasma gondii GT1]KAF4639754.1 hypothetical protein TGRH88_055260 [Toxoplasma gondii]KFG49266.1 putative transmembrane protein [Toxoplasma gondii p89]KFG56450.1 putative transmembrane protein [Toxoplasma gondii FOU]KFG66449.1 putative transmembrane protein [Toxoplasma gondii RUB]KFH01932.1 putative transmembrane protein [Toxoplasma gondii VAND]PUA86722.1 putative transmembrane protein [Toxoplasma gondii TgCATBr9]RQX67146.1 putative transmembrane prot